MKAKYLVLLLASAMLSTSPAMAKQEKKENKTEKSAEKKSQSKKSSKKKKGETEAPKDTTKVEKPSIDRNGLFHVTKMKNDWFFEIGDSLLGRDFLTTVRYTGTPANCGKFGGEQVNEQTVYFEAIGEDRLLLRSRLFVNVADTTEMINRAITISNVLS